MDKHVIVKEILYTVLFQSRKHAFDRLGYSAKTMFIHFIDYCELLNLSQTCQGSEL